MGRGSDDLIKPGIKRKIKSLDVGQDINGQEAHLGYKDSTGTLITFISEDGSCWMSVTEHDEVTTTTAFEEAMDAWQRGELAKGKPSIEEIARDNCLDPENIQAAIIAAQENWEAVEARQRQIIGERGDNFRDSSQKLSPDRHPLSRDDRHLLYPSQIQGARIHLARLTETEEEKEEAIRRITEINDRLGDFGVEPLSEELLDAIANNDERFFALASGREFTEDETRAAFEEIVSEMKDEIEPTTIWGGALDIPFGSHGDGISLESKRQGEEEAFLFATALEEKLLAGPLSEERVQLQIVATPIDPEEEKRQALDILAEGEDHPFVRRSRAFGLDGAKILEHAQRVAMGQGERPLFVASTTVFTEDLGQVEVTVSGETAEEVARRARTVLPGARYLEDEDA